MLKSILAGLLLSFALVLPAQANHDLNGVCMSIAMSMVNIATDVVSGSTEKETTQWYLDYLASQGKVPGDFEKRILHVIKVVHAIQPLTGETLEPVIEKEYNLCMSIHGDYSRLQVF